jgi:hypothetical protein
MSICRSHRSARIARRAPCNRWGDAMCAPSTRHIAEPERSGRAAPGAAPIDSEAYFLACCRYVELKAARACMIRHPRDYRWSSFRAHADGRTDPWSAITRFTGRSAAVRRHVKAPTARCFAARSKAASSRRTTPRPTVDGLWVPHASPTRSRRRRADVRRRVCPAVRRSNSAGSGDSWRCFE